MWRFRRPDELESVNLLEMAPVRLADWKERGDRVVVVRPRPTRSGVSGMIDRVLYLMSARRIRMDELGSYSWLCLDGELTVSQVANKLREKFGESVEPAEERLGHLVRVLRREGLVGLPGWDDEALRSNRGRALRS